MEDDVFLRWGPPIDAEATPPERQQHLPTPISSAEGANTQMTHSQPHQGADNSADNKEEATSISRQLPEEMEEGKEDLSDASRHEVTVPPSVGDTTPVGQLDEECAGEEKEGGEKSMEKGEDREPAAEEGEKNQDEQEGEGEEEKPKKRGRKRKDEVEIPRNLLFWPAERETRKRGRQVISYNENEMVRKYKKQAKGKEYVGPKKSLHDNNGTLDEDDADDYKPRKKKGGRGRRGSAGKAAAQAVVVKKPPGMTDNVHLMTGNFLYFFVFFFLFFYSKTWNYYMPIYYLFIFLICHDNPIIKP